MCKKTTSVSTDKALPVIKELLSAGTPIRLTVTGTSMSPTFKDRIDTVTVIPCINPIRGDILLIEHGGRLMLHRCYKTKVINGLAAVIMNGDSQSWLEGPFNASEVIGKAVIRDRKGKAVSLTSPLMRIYGYLWIMTRTLRPFLLSLKYGNKSDDTKCKP